MDAFKTDLLTSDAVCNLCIVANIQVTGNKGVHRILHEILWYFKIIQALLKLWSIVVYISDVDNQCGHVEQHRLPGILNVYCKK